MSVAVKILFVKGNDRALHARTGHIKRACNWKLTLSINPTALRTLCSQYGHAANDCKHQGIYKSRRSRWRSAISHRHRSRSPERHVQEQVTNCESSEYYKHVSNNKFLYVHVQFPNCNVSAMLDSSSSINLLSKKLYDFLPDRTKSKLLPITGVTICFANNQEIKITGCTTIYGIIQSQQHSVEVYVLEDMSHPLILGANYMRQHGLKFVFSNCQLQEEFGPRNERLFHRIRSQFHGVTCQNISIRVIKVSHQEAPM